jgi:hypothetical protein
VDRFKFLDVMLGDQPPLTPPELAYQRLLAGDSDEAEEQAEEFLQDAPLLTYYEKVLVEALKLAQEDADRGLLDEGRMIRVRDTVLEIVDDLGSYQEEVDTADSSVDDQEEPGPLAHIAQAEESLEGNDKEIPEFWRTGNPVLCVPGFGVLDEAYASIVAQAIERQGIAVRTEARDALSISRIFALDTAGVELLCVCYLSTVTTAQIRYSMRRLRRKAPDNHIVITMAGATDVDGKVLYSEERGYLVQGSLMETVAKIRAIAASPDQLAERPIEPRASHARVGAIS